MIRSTTHPSHHHRLGRHYHSIALASRVGVVPVTATRSAIATTCIIADNQRGISSKEPISTSGPSSFFRKFVIGAGIITAASSAACLSASTDTTEDDEATKTLTRVAGVEDDDDDYALYENKTQEALMNARDYDDYELNVTHEVVREHLSQTVKHILTDHNDTLVMHGLRRCGKTGLLQQTLNSTLKFEHTLTVVRSHQVSLEACMAAVKPRPMDMKDFCKVPGKASSAKAKKVLVFWLHAPLSQSELQLFLRQCQYYQEEYKNLRIIVDLQYPLSDQFINDQKMWTELGAFALQVPELTCDEAHALIAAILMDSALMSTKKKKPEYFMQLVRKRPTDPMIDDLARYACDKISDYRIGNIQHLAMRLSTARDFREARKIIDKWQLQQ